MWIGSNTSHVSFGCSCYSNANNDKNDSSSFYQEDLLVKVGGKELTPGPFQMYSGDLFDPYLNVSIFSLNLFDHMLEKYGFPLIIIVAVLLILLLNCQPKRLLLKSGNTAKWLP